MKYMIILLTILFISCESEQDIQNSIDKLRSERKELEISNDSLLNTIDFKRTEISNLNEKLKELKIYNNVNVPTYILKLKLKQSHVSFDIGTHLKDNLNTIEFEIPVDKDYFNAVSIDENIVNEFRVGSLIFSGSFGNWRMSVIDKRIEE